MAMGAQVIEIMACHHAAVADEHFAAIALANKIARMAMGDDDEGRASAEISSWIPSESGKATRRATTNCVWLMGARERGPRPGGLLAGMAGLYSGMRVAVLLGAGGRSGAHPRARPFVQLGGNGELVPINFAAFRKLIDEGDLRRAGGELRRSVVERILHLQV
jgi:hypothetical protein